MDARLLLPMLALAVPFAFGQMGFYGPINRHLKAGDSAPEISFDRMLHAPGAASWSSSNLAGGMTVLAFFPDTTHNLQAVTAWNALVVKFAGKPVQFVWMTGEGDTTLLPWLQEHPVNGWVFHDAAGKTGNAYGLELPSNIVIGPDRRIIGFYNAVEETEMLLQAAEEGRLTTERPDRMTIQAFMKSGKVAIDAEPRGMIRVEDHKPDYPPSYAVHISPASGKEHGNFSSDTYRSLQGYRLKDVIRDLYRVNPIRVKLPKELDDGKEYDFAIVLPEAEEREKMDGRFKPGVEEYFHMKSRRENQLVDVYVVTAVSGKKPQALASLQREGLGGGSIESFGGGFQYGGEGGDGGDGMKQFSIGAMRSMWVDGTAEQLCYMLEGQLDRPVINETHLEGGYEFKVERSKDADEFASKLREQSGLAISREQRNVEMLVFTAER